jgi:hypothetical protein
MFHGSNNQASYWKLAQFRPIWSGFVLRRLQSRRFEDEGEAE